MACDCIYHRYDVVHICGCGQIISHSQGDWDTHRRHQVGPGIPSAYFVHGETSDQLMQRMEEAAEY